VFIILEQEKLYNGLPNTKALLFVQFSLKKLTFKAQKQRETMAYNLLKGKRGIITGALDENSIAWKVAVRAKEEGATFTLTNAPVALRMGKIKGRPRKPLQALHGAAGRQN
jgi:hypothetical protein